MDARRSRRALLTLACACKYCGAWMTLWKTPRSRASSRTATSTWTARTRRCGLVFSFHRPAHWPPPRRPRVGLDEASFERGLSRRVFLVLAHPPAALLQVLTVKAREPKQGKAEEIPTPEVWPVTSYAEDYKPVYRPPPAYLRGAPVTALMPPFSTRDSRGTARQRATGRAAKRRLNTTSTTRMRTG